MKQDFRNEIAIRDKLIKVLENESRIKDELIRSQNEMIRTLKAYIKEVHGPNPDPSRLLFYNRVGGSY